MIALNQPCDRPRHFSCRKAAMCRVLGIDRTGQSKVRWQEHQQLWKVPFGGSQRLRRILRHVTILTRRGGYGEANGFSKFNNTFDLIGAPRSMKMGNIRSPRRYDVGAYDTPP
jgi:hypothetical protein